MGEAVESFELIPAEALRLVLRHIPGTLPPLPQAHPWHVLVESVGLPSADDSAATLTEALSQLAVEDAVVAASEAQAEALWHLRDTISEAERQEGASLKHDVSVPVSAMPRFIEEAAQAVERRFAGSRALAFGHLGDGNVHFNVVAPGGVEPAQWLEEGGRTITPFVHDLVGAMGGSISAEHGIGQMKREELARTADSTRLATLHAIKTALDPAGIMNPGKLL